MTLPPTGPGNCPRCRGFIVAAPVPVGVRGEPAVHCLSCGREFFDVPDAARGDYEAEETPLQERPAKETRACVECGDGYDAPPGSNAKFCPACRERRAEEGRRVYFYGRTKCFACGEPFHHARLLPEGTRTCGAPTCRKVEQELSTVRNPGQQGGA